MKQYGRSCPERDENTFGQLREWFRCVCLTEQVVRLADRSIASPRSLPIGDSSFDATDEVSGCEAAAEIVDVGAGDLAMSPERVRLRGTVLFADMSGSVSMYAERGDTASYEINSACLAIMAAAVQAAGGRVVRKAGDGVLAVFQQADEAISAAVNMQIQTTGGELAHHGVQIRIGLATGAVMVGGDDIYGDTVNIATRIAALAAPSEVLMCGPTFELLVEEKKSASRLLDKMALRGRPVSVPVYEYLWRRDDLTQRFRGAPSHTTPTLHLICGHEQFLVSASRPRLQIGRAVNNDVVVDGTAVSRLHARIELRGDKFVLIDCSTNGTFVYADDGSWIRVLREEVILGGSGTIALGHKSGPKIEYRITISVALER